MVILPPISYAQPSVICFAEADVKRMVVDLENVNDYREQIDLLKQSNAELEKQLDLMRQINKFQYEQLEISKQTIEAYKNLIDVQKNAYESEIKNSKYSVWEKVFVSLGVGLLIGLIF